MKHYTDNRQGDHIFCYIFEPLSCLDATNQMPALYDWKLGIKYKNRLFFQNDHNGSYFVKPCYH